MIQRSWFQTPLGATFDNFFCSSLCKDLSDNLTEMPIVKNSISFQIFCIEMSEGVPFLVLGATNLSNKWGESILTKNKIFPFYWIVLAHNILCRFNGISFIIVNYWQFTSDVLITG